MEDPPDAGDEDEADSAAGGVAEPGGIDNGRMSESGDHPWTSINPILRLRGPVTSGYGRGGKQLGVPTANVRYLYDHFCFGWRGRLRI